MRGKFLSVLIFCLLVFVMILVLILVAVFLRPLT